ncbi:hypothetical protein PSQ90_12685 [Devosia rhodophyticola]|uniref:Uncharacterized protein n=1 Tax=Devosia rhodophyticola TaxID=3026423 RepID=A0ABY7YUZ5_9HYPH|nr:hypothetical protein [Devosia rhodophyticola]WDR05141.1 hypothetical protein PSQ90_12685 [Devosia rhodophyticola]
MHKSTSGQRKSFKLYAIASSALVVCGAVMALLVGVTPASAASLARTIDPQIAAFMVPLTMLVFAILFEVARISWRGAIPKQAPAPRNVRQYWKPGQGEG